MRARTAIKSKIPKLEYNLLKQPPISLHLHFLKAMSTAFSKINILGKYDIIAYPKSISEVPGKDKTQLQISRHSININTPAGNPFEKLKDLTREEQIDKYRNYASRYWFLKGELEPSLAIWIDQCIAEINQGKIIELACNCRNHSRKRGVKASMSQPFDCYGYTLRALIMWRGGFIKPIDFSSADVDFRNAEEHPIETNPIATTSK